MQKKKKNVDKQHGSAGAMDNPMFTVLPEEQQTAHTHVIKN